MSHAMKSAGFVAFLANGERRVVCEGDALRSCEVAARQARDCGSVGKGKQAEPIIGGLVYCTWREPSVVMRFRCDPAGKSSKAED
jgi:hypothetical protein